MYGVKDVTRQECRVPGARASGLAHPQRPNSLYDITLLFLSDTTICDENTPRSHLQLRAAMPSLLLVMFTLQLVLHIVNTVGATTVNELVRPAFKSLYTYGSQLTPP